MLTWEHNIPIPLRRVWQFATDEDELTSSHLRSEFSVGKKNYWQYTKHHHNLELITLAV